MLVDSLEELLEPMIVPPDASFLDRLQGRAKERLLSCEKGLPDYAWLVRKTGPFFCTSLYMTAMMNIMFPFVLEA